MEVTCHYCNQPAKLVSGRHVYPHRSDLWSRNFWMCSDCQAWVGCYGDTSKPMGILANSYLRRWKQRAHAAFDPIWQKRYMTRTDAYAMLSQALGIPPELTHIGMFGPKGCREVIRIADEYFGSGCVAPRNAL